MQVFTVVAPRPLLDEPACEACRPLALRRETLARDENNFSRVSSETPQDASADARHYTEFPCSPGQRRFLLIDQFDPLSASLNIAMRWRLLKKITQPQAQRAIDILVARHQALRTQFVQVDGEPLQRVYSHLHLKVNHVDLRSLPNADARRQAEEIAQREARSPFRVDVAPLLRITLMHTRTDGATLLVTAHHAISDGWSMALLADEFGKLCAAEQGAEAAEILAPLEFDYGDFSLWKSQLDNHAAQLQVDAYWRQQLAGAPRFELATDYARPELLSDNAHVLGVALEPNLIATLSGVATDNGCTLFMVTCAALLAVLHRRSRARDVVIGCQLTGRDDPDLAMLVGPCINTVLLRSRLECDKLSCLELPFPTLLAEVRDTVLGALEHQHVAPETLLNILRPKRDLSRNALFAINFIFQRLLFNESPHTKNALDDLPTYPTGASCDLDVVVMEHRSGWHASIEYNSDLFQETTVRSLLDEFANMLRAIAEMPQRSLHLEFVELARFNDDAHAPVAIAPAEAERIETQPVATEVESRLSAIWSAVLGVENIARNADFFELGGHSLLAARLLARIDKEFGRRLTLPMLFKSATLAEQAKLLTAQISNDSELRSIVRLNASGSRTPIIAIVAMGNTASYYYVLARRLGEQQPFTIVQPFDYSQPRESMPQTIEEMATEYIQLIRRAQPNGPYRLLGWCITATLAFEIAQQLKRSACEVHELIIIDAWAPAHRKRIGLLRGALEELCYRLQLITDDLWKLLIGKQSLRNFVRNRHLLARLWQSIDARKHASLELKDAASEHGRLLLAHLNELVRRYKPMPYDGEVTLFRSAEEPHGYFMDQYMGWKPLLYQLEIVISVTGDHFSIFSGPGLEQMAVQLRAHSNKKNQHSGLKKSSI